MSSTSLLAILFIGLKLGGVISWSWWLVLLPLYGGILLILGIVVAFLLYINLIGLGYLLCAKLNLMDKDKAFEKTNDLMILLNTFYETFTKYSKYIRKNK